MQDSDYTLHMISGTLFRRMAFTMVLIACAATLSCAAGAGAPRSVGGVLDLGGWNFDRDGPVALRGEWEFYPGELLHEADFGRPGKPSLRHVPDLWKGSDAGGVGGQGAGTYRLRVRFSGPRSDLAIRYSTVSTAFELDAGPVRLAAAGIPAANRKDARAAYHPGVASFRTDADSVEFIVRVSNHEYRSGGMWRAFTVGKAENLILADRMVDAGTFILFGVISAMAINSITIVALRRKEFGHCVFALFAFSVALRTLFTGAYVVTDLFPDINFSLLIRLEYVSAYLMLPLAVLFLAILYPQEMPFNWLLILTLPGLPFALLILFASLPVLTRSVNYYYILAFSVMSSLVSAVVLATIRKRPGGAALLVGTLILAAAGTNDMFHSAFIINTGNLIPTALMVFVCIQAAILAKRFTDAFDGQEVLSTRLREANAALEEKMDSIVESRRMLEATVAEKDLLLKEVHHRVKNSLQIVSSIMVLQSHRESDPAVLAAYNSMTGRIRALSMLHEKLYTLDSAEFVDAGSYANDLVQQLLSGYGSAKGDAKIELETESIEAPMDLCIDFGLILTELASNAFRYAILPRGGGTISVGVHREAENLVLSIEDDGPGFPPSFVPGGTGSMGYRITTILVKKRGGRLEFPPSAGAHVRISLPLRKHQ